jgi:hypothetical protein
MLLCDASRVQGGVALCWESICVKCNQRVASAGLLERVVQSEQAGEVGSVRDERRPDCGEMGVLVLGSLIKLVHI